MDFIRPADDICLIHGTCDILGKMKKDDQESRQDLASIVPTSRVSETASLSRASAADNLSDYAWIADGHLSARAPTAESDVVYCQCASSSGQPLAKTE